ncbi:MAG TPA: PhoH family protein [Thermodesulfobacteriota bacterium]|nr:PhoH family protein [Thermodesulfobacteriota bacterium]HNU70991.1 PhoH family protein [Thermodesulfobacteriota bacterium]HOC38137.1 PhoH family protein [Thermodesulfobacteriota bacterium]
MSEKSTHTEDHNTTIKLDFEENEHLRILLGERDAHIRLIEEKIGGRIHVRGNHLTVSGDEAVAALAAKLLRELYQVVKRGLLLQTTDVDLAIRTLKNNPAVSLKELFLDTTIPVTTKKRVITPKSVNQKRYIDSIRSFDMVIGIGPAGTGKTYLAMAMAVAALLNKEIERIILTRPAVEAGEKLGFLPGDLVEKVNPYLRPLYDALHDMMDYEKASRLIEHGIIEVAPLAFMRGRTLNSSFIILDEAQNTTSEQMKMFLTRMGMNSKVVITGDITQVDLPPEKTSGLIEIQELLKPIQGIRFVYFSSIDVVRHPLVQEIIDAYGKI